MISYIGYVLYTKLNHDISIVDILAINDSALPLCTLIFIAQIEKKMGDGM